MWKSNFYSLVFFSPFHFVNILTIFFFFFFFCKLFFFIFQEKNKIFIFVVHKFSIINRYVMANFVFLVDFCLCICLSVCVCVLWWLPRLHYRHTKYLHRLFIRRNKFSSPSTTTTTTTVFFSLFFHGPESKFRIRIICFSNIVHVSQILFFLEWWPKKQNKRFLYVPHVFLFQCK